PVEFPARNVVAILPGSDAKLKGEYVAMGAHNDHIGMNDHPVDHDSMRIFNHIVRPNGADQGGKQATPEEQAEVNTVLAAWRAKHPGTARLDSISNGADDDGSGTVSVLEIAQKMASLKHKPKRSMLFVWHVGEEKGLLGSAYFTDHPTVPRDSIVAQLNMDMVGRGDAWDVTGFTKDGEAIHGSPNYVQLVGSRRLSTELGDLAESVNKSGHHGLTFDYSIDADGHPANIYCRSDHYEYARYGIPIIFFTTGLHSDYHQVTDEPEYIDYAHMARIDNYLEDLAVHVADLDHRPVVDHPKPDPHGACRQ
ncbi:MAG TPA: M28 family peptidase, partial [Gemmatimonadales bacterium]|nr:M28 family peptidase [Gemmatimonadales bacterium]